MKNFDDELEFEDDDELFFDDLDYSEESDEYSDDDSFQKKMRLKDITKGLKVSPSSMYSDSWKDEPYNPIKPSDMPLEKFIKSKKLKESDIQRIVKKVLKEQENERYMFFQNLQQIKRQCEILLSMDEFEIENLLENGHDWAQDHIATAKESIDQVFDFIMNELKKK
jgi:hypothetical protein